MECGIQPYYLRLDNGDRVGTPRGAVFPKLNADRKAPAGIDDRCVRSASLLRDRIPSNVDRIRLQATRKSERIGGTANAAYRRARRRSRIRSGRAAIWRLT